MTNKDFLITFTAPSGEEKDVWVKADTKEMAIYKFCIEYEFQLIISIN